VKTDPIMETNPVGGRMIQREPNSLGTKEPWGTKQHSAPGQAK